MIRKVGIIGLGLIGGSLAKALRSRCDIPNIVALNRSEDVLIQAYSEGVIDDYCLEVDKTFSGCDLIFICTPVDKIAFYAQALLPYIKKDCIVTDVGSTKQMICESMEPFSDRMTFIGGHPMTGSERFRYHASREHLFENAYYLLTPGKGVAEAPVRELTALLERIGALPVVLSPQMHDHTVAAISHVPHVLAAALVNQVKAADGKERYMHLLAAGGFRDITRIASSSPEMWEAICAENRSEIIQGITDMEETLAAFKAALIQENSAAVRDFFAEARQYRESFDVRTPSSVVQRYEISVDVQDRPGSIAMIAVLFSSNNINIKNMSIVNNRERMNGALHFAFDSKAQQEKSISLLREFNYTVFVDGEA